MSEKEKEEERETIDHWSHEHPLAFVEASYYLGECYGCSRRFSSGEKGYQCIEQCWKSGKLFHEECVEMPRKIRHPLHPHHTLIQQRENLTLCAVCEMPISTIGYCCASSDCRLQMHVNCAQAGGVIDDDDDKRRRTTNHPSHPQHELSLLWRSSSFKCDACGTTTRGGSSCLCTVCEYWIHQKCASLPQIIEREDHHHSLSLLFHVPSEYVKFDYTCDVCYKYLLPKYWIYHCQLCRYAVHVKCAFEKAPHKSDADEKGIIRFPIADVAEEQIRPFVMRQGGGAIAIPPIIDKYKFLHHQHELTLISSSSSHDHQNEDDDEENYGKRSELICDGCITPIFSDKCNDYMSCSECKYYLHTACFHLPPHLPSLPLFHRHGHDLILQSSDSLKPWEIRSCNVCEYLTNGLFYACTKCLFRADVKCASMPDTIHHAAHRQHLLTLEDYFLRRSSCAADCGDRLGISKSYGCRSCDFNLHVGCAALPASTVSRRWDARHQLPLTYDANLNHPGDFYCDECERGMNPKSWMYHCRHCDLSFHPGCFKTTSGFYRNIKFGQEFVNAAAHRHPLTFQLLTTKRRCDGGCGKDAYNQRGFHCASCNFFICYFNCSGKMLGDDGRTDAVD